MSIKSKNGLALANIKILTGVSATASKSDTGLSLLDSDAYVFCTNAPIVNLTQRNAVNQLTLDFKTASLWTKAHAIYPLVGGTSTTHSKNLANSASYSVTWSGGITHDSNGIKGNGTSGYGNTNLRDNVVLGQNNVSLAVYIGNDIQLSGADISNDTATNGLQINARNTADIFRSRAHCTTANDVLGITSSLGFFAISREVGATYSAHRNGETTIITQASTGRAANNILLMRLTTTYYSDRVYSFFWIGKELNWEELNSMNSIVSNYQNTLGRKTW